MEAGAGPEHRYPALRTLATVLRVLAWVILIGGALVVILATISVADDSGTGEAILTAVGGGLTVLVYTVLAFALAELIGLAIAIEDNTRRAANR